MGSSELRTTGMTGFLFVTLCEFTLFAFADASGGTALVTLCVSAFVCDGMLSCGGGGRFGDVFEKDCFALMSDMMCLAVRLYVP